MVSSTSRSQRLGRSLPNVPLRRFAAVACALLGALFVWALAAKVIPGHLSGLRAAGSLALSGRVLERAGVACGGVGAARVVGGRPAARPARSAGRRAVALRRARRHGPDVLACGDRADGRRCARLALARSRSARCARAARGCVDRRCCRRRGCAAPSRVSSDGESHHTRVRDGLVFGAVFVVGAIVVAFASRFVLSRAVDPRVARGAAVALVVLVLVALGGCGGARRRPCRFRQ